MEEILNDFSTGSTLWQILQIVVLAVIAYFLFKVYRRFNKGQSKKS